MTSPTSPGLLRCWAIPRVRRSASPSIRRRLIGLPFRWAFMPRRNRVNPFGEVMATPERGTLLGNRGVLHDEEGRIRRSWQVRRWLLCVLEFKGRRRALMAPGRYTELFFLDEATGLAAGHPPWRRGPRGGFVGF